MRTPGRRWLRFGALAMLAAEALALDPASLPPVGCHPDGISYWGSAMFANAMHQAGGWLQYSNDWGSAVAYWNVSQFNANGYPRYLNPGLNLRCVVYGLHNPANADICRGQFILTWEGDADIRFGGTFLPGKSSGAATGRLLNGRRAYLVPDFGTTTVTILDINTNTPVTSISLWMPDPTDPNHQSLEGRLWHPFFLARVGDARWGLLRMMNVQDTNANPQQDWFDRRPPTHAFMSGVLNPRAPATGFPGNRSSGMALEHMVNLCNTTTNDMWVCVPHLATDAFIRKMAQLIRFGSDGMEPTTNAVGNPVYQALSPARRVFVEYSNEIWSWGDSFAQGQWAYDQAVGLGITKEQFNARRFCQVWSIFQDVFGGTGRLGRVAAVFTAQEAYTRAFLNEIKAYGPTLSPPVEPDVVAATTYFGNGIQDWVHQKAQAQTGTADPWFYTGATFGDPARPVSLGAADPYWAGAAIERHIQESFREWTRRMLAGDAREGGGPDAVGVGGGFDLWLHDLARTNFATSKPVVAYEGGPSIYTDYMDGGDTRDDGITTFMNAMNRRAAMRDVYAIHLNMAKSKGLWMHMPFTLCSAWGKYGQWGHLENSSQNPAAAPKYQFMLDWIGEAAGLRPVDYPVGAVPVFDTAHSLPIAIAGGTYVADITVSGGNGARVVQVVGHELVPGLAIEQPAGDPDRVRITGAPSEPGLSYVYLRLTDADGDPAWRTYTVQTVGGIGTVLECDFRGSTPARHLPWTNTYARAPKVSYTGWSFGAGMFAQDGAGALVCSVNAPATESNATLALAIADGEFLGFSIQAPVDHVLNLAGAEVQFGIRRIDYHAPRRYAVLTSASGFAAGSEVFTSEYNNGSDDQLCAFRLPDTVTYRALSGPVGFRIYGFSGQYGGHKTSLISFKITSASPYSVRADSIDADGDGMGDAWEIAHFTATNAAGGGVGQDHDGDGMCNLDEYLAGTNPTNATSVLRVRCTGPASSGGMPLVWPGVYGALYRVDGRVSLAGDTLWGVVAGGVTATPPLNVYTAAVDGARQFYRVALEAVP